MKTFLRIDQLATERGYNNVHALAKASGLAYNTTHALWHNKSMRADFVTLERVARTLDVRIGDLFKSEK
jgi:DNA-binding Xre family transcriptional regulator